MQELIDPVHLPATGDMDTEALRRYGYQVVDWIADYLAGEKIYPVLSKATPGAIQRSLPQSAPLQPEKMETILEDFDRFIMPGITHWNSGNFMGFFGLSSSGPAILGDMFDAALNVTRMAWRTSPAATELEQVTLDWLRQMLGLPNPLFGMLHHNSAILNALVAAREAIPHLHIRQHGMAGRSDVPRLRFYASQEAHSSIDKAAIVLGIGQEGLRKIGTDSELRMNVEELEHAILEDLRNGYYPFAVVATVGTTSTTSIDPVVQIADICERYGIWLHVDAAYAGAAAIVPSKRWLLDGCERADSMTINPHKWLFTSFNCSVFYTRKPEVVKAAFSLTPDYLQNVSDHRDEYTVTNLMDYDAALPHRFPALKLWMVMRYFGQEGLAQRIEEHCRLAQQLAGWIKKTPSFELMAPVPLGVVCFRAHPRGIDDEEQLNTINEHLMNRINAAGHFFLSHTKVHGKTTLRVAIGNIRTSENEVRAIWKAIQGALYAELRSIKHLWGNGKSNILRMLNLPSRPERQAPMEK